METDRIDFIRGKHQKQKRDSFRFLKIKQNRKMQRIKKRKKKKKTHSRQRTYE